jgi:hypothetical protein
MKNTILLNKIAAPGFLAAGLPPTIRGLLPILLSLLTACEYEWREEPVGEVSHQQVAFQVPENAAALKPQSVAPRIIATQPPNVRPVLAPGKDHSGQSALPDGVKRLNLLDLVETGALKVSANAQVGDISLAFDEREDTLTKSEGINPYRFTFEFSAPRLIKGIRVLSSYSDYSWAFQPESGERLVVDAVVDGSWSAMAWPEGIKCSKFSLEVLRKMRDNFVHLNEIEVYE